MNATRLLRIENIKDIPHRWDEQYPPSRRDKEKEDIAVKLREHILKSDLINEDYINEIIGNESWTSFSCDVCNEERDELYYFKPTYYDPYENSGMSICNKCLGR